MEIVQSLPQWKSLRPGLEGTLGLVPTMGALHEGHLSLIRRARAETEITVLWIFVNPKQFGDDADFSSYPQVMEEDLRLAGQCGVDYVLAPGADEVYPQDFQTYVTVEHLGEVLEGAHRPGHFKGVTTVVAKMLCLTQPHKAYFGQKDAQQCVLVRRMVEDLGMLTDIVICPTIREEDGLAMSSRNVHLSTRDRKAAQVLYRALKDVKIAVRCGERDCAVLRGRMMHILLKEPRAEVDYVSIAEPETLAECDTITGPVLASLAVRIGDIRLIDNLPLDVA